LHRDNRPDALEEDTTPTVKRYFKLLGRRFWKLVGLNLIMLPMVLPLIFIFLLYTGQRMTPTATDPLFSQLYGAGLQETTPIATLLLDLFGAQTDVPAAGNTLSYVLIALCVLFLAVTFGWQNVGATYVLRNMVRGEPVFLFSDYFYAVKRNLRQGFLMGLLDALLLFLVGFDLLYFSGLTGSFWMDVCYWAVLVIGILYFFMRFYIYLMMITFELSIRKILKNALIFTALGVKRNLMGALGIVGLTAANVVLFIALINVNIAIPLILPVIYYFSFTAFTAAYAAYPVIERYMITPYQTNEENEEVPSDEEAPA
ncbi:MAG: DUF624 domain-containing protein, partial [Clostridia bacterium]|nr:DUF624 domain-containing protein [Clostridia bacterium]